MWWQLSSWAEMWGEGVSLANGITIRCLLTGDLGNDVVQKGPYSLKATKPSLTSPCRGKEQIHQIAAGS